MLGRECTPHSVARRSIHERKPTDCFGEVNLKPERRNLSSPWSRWTPKCERAQQARTDTCAPAADDAALYVGKGSSLGAPPGAVLMPNICD
eukprot:scaffold3761_cov372-Prasinococcus_capsulatus_cf.AAC.24